MRVRAGFAVSLALLLAAFGAFGCGWDGLESVSKVRELAGNANHRTVRDSTASDRTRPPRLVSEEVQSVLDSLGRLEVADRTSGTEYDRRDWRHWIDADRDCQNSRAEVLIEESQVEVSFATDERCRVTGGQWRGPWTGEIFTDASDVDIDHHVPLAHAHTSGGWRWDPERKRQYANDLANPQSLQATSASVNRTKGKKPPDAWRPENRASWCRYAADWIGVKRQWHLTVTVAEVEALEDMLDTCDDDGSWGLSGYRER